MMLQPKISVVIATRNRAALLDGALTSLRAQLGAPEIEAIVVDNGSSDHTRALPAMASVSVRLSHDRTTGANCASAGFS